MPNFSLYKILQYKLFDCLFNVRTSNCVDKDILDISTDYRKHSNAYMPTTLSQLIWSFYEIKTVIKDTKGWRFVDIGSGAGRVCFFASLKGFFEVVGIELSENLCSLAKENLENLRFINKKGLKFIQGNCLDIDFLTDNTVIYLFNPFDKSTLEQFLDRINTHIQTKKIVFVYINFESSDIFTRYFKHTHFFGRSKRSVVCWS